MKTVKNLIIVIALAMPAIGWSQATTKSAAAPKKDLKSDFSTLGDNSAVVERVKNMDTHQKVRVVQNRLVDRNNRIELAGSYSYNGGGDAYVKTQDVGATLEYHINPRWSLGLQYHKSYNSLSAEGQNILSQAQSDQQLNPGGGSQVKYPAVDHPLNSQLATVSFYPIYGKMNIFDLGISQFDVYLQLGAGQINLYRGGSSNLYSVGAGSGFWLTQRVTTRLEVRYQQYQDLIFSEKRSQSNLQAVAGLGILVW